MFEQAQQQVRPTNLFDRRRRSPIVLFILLLLWSTIVGWGITLLTPIPAQSQSSSQLSSIGTVDIVPQRYQLGQQLYLENCASCHIGIPPAVLPTETWRDILEDEQHYGKKISPLVDPERLIVWEYLRTFSRVQSPDEERTPYRVNQSRYFKALHPRVKLPLNISIGNCRTCHPGAGEYDFRTLSSEWQNAP